MSITKDAAVAGSRARSDDRIVALTKMGLTYQFSSKSYVYKDINFSFIDVMCMSDEEFRKAYSGAKQRLSVIKAGEARSSPS